MSKNKKQIYINKNKIKNFGGVFKKKMSYQSQSTSSSQSQFQSESESESESQYFLNKPYNLSNALDVITIMFIVSKGAVIGILFYFIYNNINPIEQRIKRHQIIKGAICAMMWMILFGVLCDYVDLNLLVAFESEILIIELIWIIYLITKSYLNKTKLPARERNEDESETILV